MIVFPAVIRRVDLSDALSRYEDDAVREGGQKGEDEDDRLSEKESERTDYVAIDKFLY